jgi:dihydroorotate dehydrogenase electron transfer subunit
LFVLRLGETESLSQAEPGQFVMARGDWGRDPLLPRAFSILSQDGGVCSLLVKAVGRGTRLFETVERGQRVSVLGPLGRAFPTPAADAPGDWLVAGGVGLAPLLWYAQRTRPHIERNGGRHRLLYGARTAAELALLPDLRASGAELVLATEDGSAPPGHEVVKGRVTDALERLLSAERAVTGAPRVLTCGPNAMMRKVVELAQGRGLPAIVSVEGEMACGIGACLGCAIPLTDGTRPFAYACVDGPVFDAGRIVIP